MPSKENIILRATIVFNMIVLAILLGCQSMKQDEYEQTEGIDEFFHTLDQCDRDHQIIAYGDNLCLDAELFKTQYLAYASVASVKDSQVSRLLFLEELIDRMNIARWAESKSLLSEEDVIMNLEGHLRVQTAKKWTQDQVRPLVKEITNEDIRHAFKKKNPRLELAQIFAFEQSVITEYQQRLQNGEDFILLAKESMKKVGEDSTHYYMGWIGWKDMGIGPEDTAYSLEPGQISTPVSSRNGWHIFLLLNKEERFYADQSTFENERQSLAEAIYARRVEERSHSWVDSLRMQYLLELHTSNLASLEEWLKQQNLQSSPYLIQEKARLEIQDETFRLDEDVILAKYGPYNFTTKDFLIALPHIPTYLLTNRMREAVEFAITDYLFSEKAIQDSYLNDSAIQNLLRLAKINVLNSKAVQIYTQKLMGSEASEETVFDPAWIINTRNQLIQELKPSLESVKIDTHALNASIPYIF